MQISNFEKYVFPPEQMAYIKQLKSLTRRIYGDNPKACVVTYGCQQNVSDSEHYKGMLSLMGFEFINEPSQADFILYNTCAVRGHAEDRVYGNIGVVKNYKRKRENIILAVCGCMAQQSHVAERIRKSYPYVDIVFGTQLQHRLPEFLYKRLSGGGRIFELSLENKEIVEDIPISRDGELKGWLPIMYGCNNFCTYCIVPYVRGRERSRHPVKILAEAREMVKAGFKDITLLGQNVNSYGKGCDFNMDFADLIREINNIEGDFRIRFMTSHPKDCTLKLLDAMRDCEKVAHHLHLPFQSGSDRILKQMNRHYDRKTYLELIEAARERIPDISITSDIIVGFPGETYDDFKETLSLVEKVRFSSLFTFIYSPREGTPASVMDDPISREEKGKWFNELLALQDKIAKENSKSFIGKTFRVLCDDYGKAPGIMSGHTSGNCSVEFEADENLLGKFVNIEITDYTNMLSGKIVK